MKTLLVKFALWILRHYQYEWGVNGIVLMRATELCVEAEKTFGSGYGEAKRHAVYAKLIKDFPQRTKGELADAIQIAVRYAS